MKNNKQIQKERDRKIIEFIDHFQSARTSTIHELFFIKKDGKHTSTRMTRERLNSLVKDKQLKCDREHINKQYYYYLSGRKPTSQLKHTLLITDFYRELHKLSNVKVKAFSKVEINEIIPDAIGLFTINDLPVYFFLEVEISNKKFDIDKYIRFKYKKEYELLGLDHMPTLIVVTNKRNLPQTDDMNIIKIRTDLSDINKLIQD